MPTEQTVQSAVWQLELGRGKTVLRWVVVILVAATLSLLYTANEFRGLERREAMDMAQLARNISRGEGFTTSVLRPVALWHLKTFRADHKAQFEKHPDTYNPPLYPFLLSTLFRITPASIFAEHRNEPLYPPERWVIVPLNQILLLATLLLVYFWAQRLFDYRVALMAALLLLFSDTLWAFSVSGLPTMLLLLLFLSSVYVLFLADQRLNPPEATPVGVDAKVIGLVVAGAVLLGLCFLARYSSLFLMVPLGIYVARIFTGRRPMFWTAIYVAVVLAVITPWLVRNFAVSHSLLGTAKYQYFSTEQFERTYSVDLKEAVTVRAVTSRFLTTLRRVWTREFRSVGTDVLIFFFVAGIFYGFRRTDAARLRRILVFSLFIAMIAMAIVGLQAEETDVLWISGSNLLVIFLPLVAVFGCAFFYLLLDRIAFRMQLTRGLAVAAFVAVNILPMLFSLLPPHRGAYPYPPYCQPVMQSLAKWYATNEVGVSDMPWATAWYMDRRSVWLPMTPEEFYEIHDFVAPHNTQFVLLTPYMLNRHLESEILYGEFKPWSGLILGQMPENFPFHTAVKVPPGTDQLLITDRARWAGETNVGPNIIKQEK